MNEQQLTMTRLLGKKELTAGCLILLKEKTGIVEIIKTSNIFDLRGHCGFEDNIPLMRIWISEIIGHTATLSDLHRWIYQKRIALHQNQKELSLLSMSMSSTIDYDISKDLLDQSPDTMTKIIELVNGNP